MERFRQILVVGRAKTRKECAAEGRPLWYSGSEVRHPALRELGSEPIRWRVVFWFWVPAIERRPRAFRTEVKDARPFELAALASGELEEVAINCTFPADMPTRDASAWLRAEYDRRCFQRLGAVAPPTPIVVGRDALAAEQARTKIVLL